MTLHWFTPDKATNTDPARYADDLYVLGIRLCPELDAEPTYQMVTHPTLGRILMMRAGQLTYYPTSGLIKVWPYRNVGDSAKTHLLGAAALAFHHRPCKADSWKLRRTGKGLDGKPFHYWWTDIRVGIDPDGQNGLWFARAAATMDDRLRDHQLASLMSSEVMA